MRQMCWLAGERGDLWLRRGDGQTGSPTTISSTSHTSTTHTRCLPTGRGRPPIQIYLIVPQLNIMSAGYDRETLLLDSLNLLKGKSLRHYLKHILCLCK